MIMSTTNRHRRFQFSLRGLFFAVTAIALIIGAWVLSPGERQRRAVQRIQRLGGTVNYETPELPDSMSSFPSLVLRTCLPRDYFDPVIGVNLLGTPALDADMKSLRVFSALHVLNLNQTAVSDQGLIHLRRNRNLVIVFIGDTKVTEQGIAEFKKAVPNCDVRQK